MTTEKRHYTNAERARIYVEQGRGGTFDGKDAAAQSLSLEQLTAFSVAALLEVFIDIEDALAKRFLERTMVLRVKQAKDRVERQIQEREASHGPCPDALRKYIFREAMQVDFRYLESRMEHYRWIEPPEQHHPLRKEYDRWMKRRIKRTK